MRSHFLKVCSWILTLVLLINMLPAPIRAQELTEEGKTDTLISADDEASIISTADSNITSSIDSDNRSILMEIVDKRTEYSKEYKLVNGMHMTVMYPEPIHYQKDGKWKDVDSTLKMIGTGDAAMFTNTADAWQVMLPQAISQDRGVSITADGYTISFQLVGEISKPSASSVVARDQATLAAGEELLVASTQRSEGTVRLFDYATQKAQAKHPETILDKLRSRLTYADVYQNTDLIYDLSAGLLKESIVIKEYDATLRGYQYILNTGSLVPVLNDDGSIDLFSRNSEIAIFSMPAPYMIDNSGEMSFDVHVALENKNGAYVLTYTLPTGWMASESREWPVILDPMVTSQGYYDNVQDKTIMESKTTSYTASYVQCGWREDSGIQRGLIQFNEIPTLSSADIIIEATLRMQKTLTSDNPVVVEIHKVGTTWQSTTVTWNDDLQFDTSIEDFAVVQASGEYTWNITELVRGWYTGGNTGLMFKASDAVEKAGVENVVLFRSSDIDVYHPELAPTLTVIHRNSNGLESYWDYTVTSAGRAGTGYVNNFTGNMTWVHSDLGFGGNLMPVSISHIYNVHDYGSNEFGLGLGWRTNYNQLIGGGPGDDGEVQEPYYWQDSDGTKHYFVADSDGTLVDEDGLNLTLTVNSGTYIITDQKGNTSHFDSSKRLVRITNNQATSKSIIIEYEDGTNHIERITDGADRSYYFAYTNNLLSKISYISDGSSEISCVTFTYSDSRLTAITYKDGKSSTFVYADASTDPNVVNMVLHKAVDIDGYSVQYTYSGSAPHRVIGIAEYDDTTLGSSISIEYAHHQTTFKDHKDHVQIMQFNDWGDVISIQDDLGRAQFAQYALNGYNDEGVYEENNAPKRGHQLTLSSKLQNTVVNLLRQSSFESSNIWTALSSEISSTRTTSNYYVGAKSLKMTRSAAGTASGLYAPSVTVSAGESYTFSGYVKTGSSANAYLALAVGGTVVATSETLTGVTTWTRLQVSYTNTGSTAVTLRPQFMTTTAGSVYLDGVQLEKAPTASRYNLLENGDFRTTYTWSSSSGRATASAAAPQLDSTAYCFEGNPTAAQSISQTVTVSGEAGDTFILSGWAKGDSAPLKDNREFGLKLTFNYTDGTTSEQTVSFNPSCDSRNSWQYAATAVSAESAYSSVKVELLYSYNVNDAYFDGIQLFKEEFGSTYHYNANGNVVSAVDIQGQSTNYTYDSNNNLKTVTLPDSTSIQYEYDTYHNIVKATTAAGVVYEFTYDALGNNTSVSIRNGSAIIRSSATYTGDGNRLHTTTDALGAVTTYNYDADTNVLISVQYPKDTEEPKTIYTYDNMYRLQSVQTAPNQSPALSAQYAYTDDLLTSIQTGAKTYSFTYGDFSQCSSIKVGNKILANYTYNSEDHLLSGLAYGNGNTVQYTYDSYGRPTAVTYSNSGTVSYDYDNDGNLASVTDSATGLKTKYFYNFLGNAMKITRSGSNFSHTSTYGYNDDGLLEELFDTVLGTVYKSYYYYDADNRISQVYDGGVKELYTYDALGRLSGRTAYISTTKQVWKETFSYHSSSRNDEATTTDRVYRQTITASGYSPVYQYTYHTGGNLASFSDGTNQATYSYDSANQLTRENNPAAGKTWVWTYDNAGNILSRTEYAYTTGNLGTVLGTDTYTYGDANWRDLLTKYNGKTITYDGVGNPLSDGTWTYAWNRGRQLASMTNGSTTWTYSYNADGLRYKKTNGTTTYTYYYNGSLLRYVDINGTKLYFVLDASGQPIEVSYRPAGGTVAFYYYVHNIMGDVTAILDTSGNPVVQYTYDAWGNILSISGSMASTLGVQNPFRYRGYVYDQETGLYYLQSRYYNPEWGRFLNADVFVSTGQGLLGNNMFAYCNNNPVNRYDPAGFCGLCLTTNAESQFAFVADCGRGSGGRTSVGGGIILLPIPATLAEETAALIISYVATLAATTQKRTQHVYVLTDPGADGIVKYVGRTNNPARRWREHQNDPRHPERAGYLMDVVASGLTLDEARLVEQILISAFTLDHLENARREIAVGHINAYHQYMGAATEIFAGATENGLLALLGG